MSHGATAPVAVVAALATALLLGNAGAIRERADAGMGKGIPEREAALARGFVLGDDSGVDPATESDFRRAGLSHLLAVSGQNVTLLGLLALPLLAALGLPLRARLVWVLGLIGAYVALTGASPSIQRAGVMGALGLLATLGGRRSSRLHALALAAVVTLAVDPAIGDDVGWQLSFAAVLAILLLAAPLAGAARARLRLRGALGGTLAEGGAMTVAATLGTAPLIAFHFGELSTVGLLANLLALPAVAPAMWLGMLSAAGSQVPGVPVELINLPVALLTGYVASVAAWCASPAWATLDVDLGGEGLALSYVGVFAAIAVLRRRPAVAVWLAVAAVVATGAGVLLSAGSPGAGPPAAGLRVTVFDVGQGDAILFQPSGAQAVLVDGGPPGDGLVRQLGEAGVAGLGAAIVTHDQSDHAAGIEEALEKLPVGTLGYAVAGRDLLEEARGDGARTRRLAAGSELRVGRLRLDVLWPPRPLLTGSHAGDDPNRLALVMVARWRGFSMLLTADAEAESTPIEPGPIDVLKVAHHGSEDAGLAGLLERTSPRLAVISVGAGNPYGHPDPSTLAVLATHGVRTLRTDRDGAVVLEVGEGRLRVEGRS